jgi:hypothetical protein
VGERLCSSIGDQPLTCLDGGPCGRLASQQAARHRSARLLDFGAAVTSEDVAADGGALLRALFDELAVRGIHCITLRPADGNEWRLQGFVASGSTRWEVVGFSGLGSAAVQRLKLRGWDRESLDGADVLVVEPTDPASARSPRWALDVLDCLGPVDSRHLMVDVFPADQQFWHCEVAARPWRRRCRRR